MDLSNKDLQALLDHIQPICSRITAAGLLKLANENMPPDIGAMFLVIQGYLNGAVDTETAILGVPNDLDRRIYGNKLKQLLATVRQQLEAKIRQVQDQIAKREGRRNRHGDDGP